MLAGGDFSRLVMMHKRPNRASLRAQRRNLDPSGPLRHEIFAAPIGRLAMTHPRRHQIAVARVGRLATTIEQV
jgi:hypothetical protein